VFAKLRAAMHLPLLAALFFASISGRRLEL
jgi:hypothetical protein